MDSAAKADQLEVEQARIASQEKIAGMAAGAKAAKDRNQLELEKMKVGIDLGKSIAESHKESQQPSKKETK